MSDKKHNWLSRLLNRKEGAHPEVTQPVEAEGQDAPAQAAMSPLYKSQEQIRAEEQHVPLEWKVGDVILDTYEVKEIHEGGGMGLVYRVHHRNWNMDLAVKSPRANFFQTQQQKDNFVRECETWIDLGLHPHIVSCHYVRNLGGIPRVFAEYVEGGTLKDWIDSRKLYEGGPEKALERILDIAIQMAWGLQYAHDKGLIHQDVKPANVLMTEDCTAKVSDFGLARARAAAGEKYVPGSGRSILVSTGGMTPAYCSPEQANHQSLSHKTDIWSWAVSMLEMFTGEVTWMAGQAADQVLEEYFDKKHTGLLKLQIPEMLRKILVVCLHKKPDARQLDMDGLTGTLKAISILLTGKPYKRKLLGEVLPSADILNNKALSMIDIGKTTQAFAFWKEALSQNSCHLPSLFNSEFMRCRMGQVSYNNLLNKLKQMKKQDPENKMLHIAIFQVYRDLGDSEQTEEGVKSTDSFRKEIAGYSKDAKGIVRYQGRFIYCQTLSSESVRFNYELLEHELRDVRRNISVGRYKEAMKCLVEVRLLKEYVHDQKVLDLWNELARRGRRISLRNIWSVSSFVVDEGVKACSVSRDLKWILTASNKGRIAKYSMQGKLCAVIRFPQNESLYAVCLGKNDDSRWALLARSTLFSRHSDQFLGLVDLEEKKLLRFQDVVAPDSPEMLIFHNEANMGLFFLHNEEFAFGGLGARRVGLWHVKSGRLVCCFGPLENDITGMCLGPDERWVAILDNFGHIHVWCIENTRSVIFGEQKADPQFSLLWRSVSTITAHQRGVCYGNNMDICLFDFPKKEFSFLSDHSGQITSVCISTSGNWIFAGTDKGYVKIWNVADKACIWTSRKYEERIVHIKCSMDDRYLVVVLENGMVDTLELDWEIEMMDSNAPGDNVLLYLETFLVLHSRSGIQLPKNKQPSTTLVNRAFSRNNRPKWTDSEFAELMYILGCAGFGWLRPADVKRRLEKMAADWNGPPPLPWEK